MWPGQLLVGISTSKSCSLASFCLGITARTREPVPIAPGKHEVNHESADFSDHRPSREEKHHRRSVTTYFLKGNGNPHRARWPSQTQVCRFKSTPKPQIRRSRQAREASAALAADEGPTMATMAHLRIGSKVEKFVRKSYNF